MGQIRKISENDNSIAGMVNIYEALWWDITHGIHLVNLEKLEFASKNSKKFQLSITVDLLENTGHQSGLKPQHRCVSGQIIHEICPHSCDAAICLNSQKSLVIRGMNTLPNSHSIWLI